MARPCQCWSPACYCHLVIPSTLCGSLPKVSNCKSCFGPLETVMEGGSPRSLTSTSKLYLRFHYSFGGPFDFYCAWSQARVRQTGYQGCGGEPGYFCSKPHNSPSCWYTHYYILKLYNRVVTKGSFTPPKRMNFWKSSKRGGGHFQSKNFCCKSPLCGDHKLDRLRDNFWSPQSGDFRNPLTLAETWRYF